MVYRTSFPKTAHVPSTFHLLEPPLLPEHFSFIILFACHLSIVFLILPHSIEVMFWHNTATQWLGFFIGKLKLW